jgi:hypothetical protein
MALEESERRRRWHRQDTVRRLYGPVTRSDRPTVHSLDAELVESPYTANDVEDRVDRTNLMQMDTLNAGRMQRRFLLGDHRERAIRALFDPRWQRRARHDLSNMLEVTSVRLRGYVEVHLLARDLAALDVGNSHGDPLEA